MSAYVIEAMLLRWSESHNGRTVTLQLPPEGDHPFRGLKCGPANGQRLALSVALIADDETTTPHEMPSQPSEKPASGGNGSGADKRRFTELPKSQQAALCCKDAWFHTYLDEKQGCDVRREASPEHGAIYALYALFDVDSRRAFDNDPAMGAAWDAFYEQYIVWRDNP